KYNRPLTGISQAAYQQLFAHRWPGNVRELQNALERAVLLAKGTQVEPEDLPFGKATEQEAAPQAFYVPPNVTLAEIEKAVIAETLKRTEGNKLEAARVLGIHRPRRYSKIRKYKLEITSKPGRRPKKKKDEADPLKEEAVAASAR
ncbi:MAG: hypothetical protein HOP19_07775, partial [Acidobacteria bacterium]|nr:hypothetical protein [Acidobacteriota bacterium]